MIYRILFLIILIFLFSCETNISTNKDIKFKNTKGSGFTNKGFAMIYDKSLFFEKKINKKMNASDFIIFQKNLKKGTRVLITNLQNNKTVIAKVGSNSEYPFFYNSVISPRISNILNVDVNNPYIEIKKIISNNLFVANTAKTYEEEKTVAAKAPVEKINIKDLSLKKTKIKKVDKNNFNYAIFIADFYFKDSSKLMVSRIMNNTSIKNIKIKKINNNQYRVIIGPFNDLNSLKNTFNELRILNFENLEIIKI
tara:strand:+ start:199 stop:957 length:759 start_codon:yes stop_codon:yes gene_type:complete